MTAPLARRLGVAALVAATLAVYAAEPPSEAVAYRSQAVTNVPQTCGDLTHIADGTVYCLEEGHPRVYRIRRNGAVDKIFDGEEHSGSPMQFESLAVANDETLYGASRKDHVVIRIAAHSRKVVVYAGGFGQVGASDGAGMAAKFNTPGGMVIDRTGRLWIADTRNHTVRTIDRKGRVTTVAGAAGQRGRADGDGPRARFDRPERLALAPDGAVLVEDAGTSALRRIDPDTMRVETVAELGAAGCPAGTCCAAGCNTGIGALAVDRAGVLFVIDGRGGAVWRVGPGGRAQALAADRTQPDRAKRGTIRSLTAGAGDALYVGETDGLIRLEPPGAKPR
jgi:sugar lactone lactonase YvrE